MRESRNLALDISFMSVQRESQKWFLSHDSRASAVRAKATPDARFTQSRERFLGISACTFGTCITTFLSTMKSISFLAHSVSESKEHDHSWSSSWRRAIFAREMDNKFVSFLRRSVGRDGIHGKSISTVCPPPLSSHCDINGSSMRRRRR